MYYLRLIAALITHLDLLYFCFVDQDSARDRCPVRRPDKRRKRSITLVPTMTNGQNKNFLHPEIILFCLMQTLCSLLFKYTALLGQEKQRTLQAFCYTQNYFYEYPGLTK